MADQIQDFMAQLSDEQRAAAIACDDPAMIIAGAGSGKTRTLVARFIHLITPVARGGLGADPASIMMVTFTNKAAREMRERIVGILDDLFADDPARRREPWIGTFHGLSLRILRIESKRVGLGQNFSIFDEADARSLATDVVQNLDIGGFDVDDFFRDLDLAKARLLSPDLLSLKKQEIDKREATGEKLDPMLDRWKRILAFFKEPHFITVYSAYQTALSEQNAVDFSDLMNKVTTLFRENPDIRLSWMSTFRHFMVDEVQDINHAQVAWLDMFTNGARPVSLAESREGHAYADASDGLAEVNTYRLRQFPRPTIAFVGDDDQSIYAFRGSDVRVMRSLDKKFPGIKNFFLRQSYRCQPSILSIANTLVGHNRQRFEKTLVAADPERGRTPVRIRYHKHVDKEIAQIRQEASDHIAAGGDPSEFGILLRTRDLARVVARELRASGLPVTEGKASDIHKSAEVRDAMAYASFLVNNNAEIHLRRVINKPSRGLGPTSMGRVNRNARLKGVGFVEELRSIMNNRIEIPENGESYGKAFIRNLRQFGEMVVQLRAQMNASEHAGDAMMRILETTGYLENLKLEAMQSIGLSSDHPVMNLPPGEFLQNLVMLNRMRQSDEKKTAKLLDEDDYIDEDSMLDRVSHLSETARRIGNLHILIQQARHHPDLETFMQEATLDMNQHEAQAGIQVMTIHASKGLEFDRVRLPFWARGVMPHNRALEGGGDDLEEERRLAYVALTRAREDIAISFSESAYGYQYLRNYSRLPSGFLKEIRSAPAADLALSNKTRGPIAQPQTTPDHAATADEAADDFARFLERRRNASASMETETPGP